MTVIDVSRDDVGRRAGPDVARHRLLSSRLIRDRLRQAIADFSVVTMGSKARKVSIHVPVLPEYEFQYSHRVPCCGAGGRTGSRGEIIPGKPRQTAGPGGSGDGGEPVYELIIDEDEIAEFLFEDLKLPNFLRKQLRRTVVIETGGRVGSVRQGPMVRLNRRSTLRQLNRRTAGLVREGVDSEEDEGLIDDDLRFFRVSKRPREISNGVCILMMDVSGSMMWRQKYLCRAFFWLLVQFVRSKYAQVEVEFIIHHSNARIVDEDQFFHTTESGGTVCSSAYQLALDLIGEKYPPEAWNVYAFHMSDGDNFEPDNKVVPTLIEKLATVCSLVGYGQVSGWYEDGFSEEHVNWSQLFKVIAPLCKHYDNVRLVQVRTEQDVYPQFRHLLEGDKVKGGKP